jgi:hypothetical protein
MARRAKPARAETGVVWNGRCLGQRLAGPSKSRPAWRDDFTEVAAATVSWSDREALGEIPAPTVFASLEHIHDY